MGKIIQNGIEYGKSYSAGKLIEIDYDEIRVKFSEKAANVIERDSKMFPTYLFYTTGTYLNMNLTSASLIIPTTGWLSENNRYVKRLTCEGIDPDSHVVMTVNYAFVREATEQHFFIHNQSLNMIEFIMDSIPNQSFIVDLIWWR